MKRGFSLLEIVVAAGLLALIGSMLVQSLSSSIDTKEAVESVSNRYHVVRSGMSRMVDEISMAYLSKHQSLTEARSRTGFKGERDKINFTAFGYVPRVQDEKKSDQRQLGYALDTDPRTQTQSVMRREQVNIDDNFEEGGRTLTLMPNVRELRFEYFDDVKGEWQEVWDAAGTELDRLPARIRIHVTAVMDDGQEQVFVTQTKLWMQKPLNF